MFKKKANTMFNQDANSCETICRMHEQMTRLYEAAKKLRQVEGKTDVARIFDATPQTLNNWENRGISNEGLLKAQEHIGCDAIWLRDGTGQMIKGSQTANSNLSDVAHLVTLYANATDPGRELILSTANNVPKRSGGSGDVGSIVIDKR